MKKKGKKPLSVFRSDKSGLIVCSLWPGIPYQLIDGTTKIRTARVCCRVFKCQTVWRDPETGVYSKKKDFFKYTAKENWTVDEAIEMFWLLKKGIDQAIKMNLESGYGLPKAAKLYEKVASQDIIIKIKEGDVVEHLKNKQEVPYTEILERRAKTYGQKDKHHPGADWNPEYNPVPKPSKILTIDGEEPSNEDWEKLFSLDSMRDEKK